MIPPKNFHSKFFFEIQVWFVFIEIILHIVIWYYIVQIYPLYVCILLSGQPNSHWLLLVLCLVLLLYFINSFVHFSVMCKVPRVLTISYVTELINSESPQICNSQWLTCICLTPGTGKSSSYFTDFVFSCLFCLGFSSSKSFQG